MAIFTALGSLAAGIGGAISSFFSAGSVGDFDLKLKSEPACETPMASAAIGNHKQ